jgi:nitrate/nitrite transport system ATP-binding protein
MSILTLTHVSKSYGALSVLQDINLTIERGEFVAIVGYSGSGKTTLISLIAGLLQPDAGTLTLHGDPIVGPGPERGIVFQNYSLLPWLTVYENVALAVSQVFPKYSPDELRAHTEKFIAMVNLSPARDKRPRELSGGMRQRVSVARALAMEPEILLLDEPLSALDALTRATLQDEIERIWESQKRTVVLITNDVDEALLLADRIIPLTPGPGATLGDPVAVSLDRPRDRKALNHDPEFKRLRVLITQQLLSYGQKRRTGSARRPTAPSLVPDDLDRPRSRRSLVRTETAAATS